MWDLSLLTQRCNTVGRRASAEFGAEEQVLVQTLCHLHVKEQDEFGTHDFVKVKLKPSVKERTIQATSPETTDILMGTHPCLGAESALCGLSLAVMRLIINATSAMCMHGEPPLCCGACIREEAVLDHIVESAFSEMKCLLEYGKRAPSIISTSCNGQSQLFISKESQHKQRQDTTNNKLLKHGVVLM